MTDHYRKLKNMYEAAPGNANYDAKLDVGDREAEIRIPVTEEYFHPLGAAHGSLVFKALDDAAFFAANSVVEDVFLLTADYTIYFSRPISEGTLRAEGEIANETGSRFVCESVAYDDDGNEVARGSGTFVRSNVELTPQVGYEL